MLDIMGVLGVVVLIGVGSIVIMLTLAWNIAVWTGA